MEISNNEELLRNTIDSCMDMIQVFKAVRNKKDEIVDFVWVLNNKASEERYGNVVGKSLLTLNPGVIKEGIFDTFKQVVETGVPDQSIRHYMHEQFNGWFQQSTVKLGDGITTTTKDITELTNAKQDIERSHALLQSIIDNSLDVIQVFEAIRDTSGKIIDFKWTIQNNKGLLQNADVIGDSVLQQNPGVVESGLFQSFVAVTEGGVPIDHEVFYEFEQFNSWFRQTLVKFNDGFIMTTEDISERKKSQQEILYLKDEVAKIATDKYYSIFNAIDDGFCIYELIYTGEQPVDLRWIEVNPAYEKQTGLKNVVGKLHSDLHLQTEDHWFELYDKVIRTGETVYFEQRHESTGRWYRTYSSRIGDAKARQVAVVFEDITERKFQEHKQQFLLRFNDVLRTISDTVEIEGAVTAIAMEYFGADRCYYCEIENGNAVIRRDARREGLAPVEGAYPLSEFALFETIVNKKQPLVVHDAHTTTILDEPLRQLCLQLQVISFLDVPVVKNDRVVSMLCVVQTKPRSWTVPETKFAVEVAERIWDAVERARAEELVRKREKELARVQAIGNIGGVDIDVEHGLVGQRSPEFTHTWITP